MTLFAVYVTIVVLICTFFLICKWNNVALSIPNIYDDGEYSVASEPLNPLQRAIYSER